MHIQMHGIMPLQRYELHCSIFFYFEIFSSFKSIIQFKNGKKRGWNELLFDSILIKLESDIQYNYLKFEHKNEKKQEFVQVSIFFP